MTLLAVINSVDTKGSSAHISFAFGQSDIHRKPAGQITLNEVCRVTRSEGAHTFEVNTGKKTYYLTADNTALVEDWVRVLQVRLYWTYTLINSYTLVMYQLLFLPLVLLHVTCNVTRTAATHLLTSRHYMLYLFLIHPLPQRIMKACTQIYVHFIHTQSFLTMYTLLVTSCYTSDILSTSTVSALRPPPIFPATPGASLMQLGQVPLSLRRPS